MAKTTPIEFANQVKAEAAKIAWPTRRETVTTAIMVVIMAVILGIFFFVVDSAFGSITEFVITKLAGN